MVVYSGIRGFFLFVVYYDLLFWWLDFLKFGFDRVDFIDYNVKGLDMFLKYSWFIIKIDLEIRK